MRVLFVTTNEHSPPPELLERLGAGVEVFTLPADGEKADALAIARLLIEIEAAAESHRPDAALIGLDGDAALAAALVFAKLPVPVARIALGTAGDTPLADLLFEAVLPDADAAVAWLDSQALLRRS